MVFTSFEFILFLPFTILVYFLLNVKWRWLWILIASYFFYGYHNPFYVLLLFLSTSIDFICGNQIYLAFSKLIKRRWLLISIFSNLGLLFFFKYFNFFSNQIHYFFEFFGNSYTPPKHNFLLPIGISFYTFQTLSYSIDIYRGFLKPETHFGKFALYVCFFPQLVAGPIERAKDLLTQFHFKYHFEYQRVVEGLRLILWGVFKKLVLADRIAVYVTEVFTVSNDHSGIIILIATFLFFLQIFYDFSAYSDIAIGIARILGIKLSNNFGNHIYFGSVISFWQNWHITLTHWFRDYVFFPLTELYKKKWFWYLSLFISFTLIGLWHGAKWTYIAWGSINGLFLIIDYLTTSKRKLIFAKISWNQRFPRLWSFLIIVFIQTFFLIPILFFRAESIQDAFTLLLKTFNFSKCYLLIDGISNIDIIFMFAMVFCNEIFSVQLKKLTIYQFLSQQSILLRWSFYITLICLILYFRIPESPEFIYFEF